MGPLDRVRMVDTAARGSEDEVRHGGARAGSSALAPEHLRNLRRVVLLAHVDSRAFVGFFDPGEHARHHLRPERIIAALLGADVVHAAAFVVQQDAIAIAPFGERHAAGGIMAYEAVFEFLHVHFHERGDGFDFFARDEHVARRAAAAAHAAGLAGELYALVIPGLRVESRWPHTLRRFV